MVKGRERVRVRVRESKGKRRDLVKELVKRSKS